MAREPGPERPGARRSPGAGDAGPERPGARRAPGAGDAGPERPGARRAPGAGEIDSLGFLDSLEGLPEQLAAAHQSAGSIGRADLPGSGDVRNVAVLGMGGSGIAGDVLVAAGGQVLPVPVAVVKQYRAPAFIDEHTLAFALSYSGDTEETLTMAEHALDAGARLVAISVGGALAELAEQRGALHVACPPGYMPRAALGALLAPMLVTLSRAGVLPEADTWMVHAQEQLARRRERCRPAVTGAANPAREVARLIDRTIPLLYGGDSLGAVAAYRWKCDVNENAKAPAFWNAYPELDHNEICGWGVHGDVTRQIFTLVELRHDYEDPRVERRFAATRAIIEETLVQVLEVRAEGVGRLAQLLDLMYVGDWASSYLALDQEVDPGPIDAIFQLKQSLGQ